MKPMYKLFYSNNKLSMRLSNIIISNQQVSILKRSMLFMKYRCCPDSTGVVMGTLKECAGSIVGGEGF